MENDAQVWFTYFILNIFFSEMLTLRLQGRLMAFLKWSKSGSSSGTCAFWWLGIFEEKKSLDSFVKDEICYKAFELKFWSTSNIKLHKHIWSSLKRWDWKFVNLVVWKKCCVKGWTHFLCLCYYTFWFLLFNSSLLSGRENYANLIGS